jgi:hypothetical protein
MIGLPDHQYIVPGGGAMCDWRECRMLENRDLPMFGLAGPSKIGNGEGGHAISRQFFRGGA